MRRRSGAVRRPVPRGASQAAEGDGEATDDPLHGDQEGRFFHDYYGGYCYLPLDVFCGRHLLAARLRRSNIAASAGAVEGWRASSPRSDRAGLTSASCCAPIGFAREALMAWYEVNGVDYVLGLARNTRLGGEIDVELIQAEDEALRTGRPARLFRDFRYATLDSLVLIETVLGLSDRRRL